MSPRRQTGVALLTVLLVVFLGAIAATALSATQQLAVRRSTLLLHQEQARLIALSAEQWAAATLEDDSENSEKDDLHEDWAAFAPTVPVEGGSVSGTIEDLQGRFNLNNLLAEKRPDQSEMTSIDPKQLEALQRLLEQLNLNPDIAQAIADWIDPDQELRFPGGAEDGVYAGRDPPYLAANQPLVSLSELHLIQGIDEEAFQALLPYVSALPRGSRINLNTASNAVLNAVTDTTDLDMEKLLGDRRKADGFASSDEFFEAAGLEGSDFARENLTVASDYFLVSIEARVGDSPAVLHSVIHRQGASTRVIMRSFGDER